MQAMVETVGYLRHCEPRLFLFRYSSSLCHLQMSLVIMTFGTSLLKL